MFGQTNIGARLMAYPNNRNWKRLTMLNLFRVTLIWLHIKFGANLSKTCSVICFDSFCLMVRLTCPCGVEWESSIKDCGLFDWQSYLNLIYAKLRSINQLTKTYKTCQYCQTQWTMVSVIDSCLWGFINWKLLCGILSVCKWQDLLWNFFLCSHC